MTSLHTLRTWAMAFAGWLERLGLHPADKWAHGIVGAVLAAALALLGFSALESAVEVLIMALVKEWIDSADGGTPDPQDVLATMAVPIVWLIASAVL